MSLTSIEARPDAGFYQGLLDEDDPDTAVMLAAQAASNAMMAKQLAARGHQ